MRAGPASTQIKPALLRIVFATSLACASSAAFGAVTSELTYSFAKFDGTEYPTFDPVNQEIESDNTTYELYFSDWLFDNFAGNADIALNPDETLTPTISDSTGDSFQLVEFTTEVFCGEPISFDVVGYEDGSQVAGPQSITLSSQGGPTSRTIGFASVDEIQLQSISISGGSNGECVAIDDIIVDQAVTSNTQPSFVGLDATVTYDEVNGSPVVIDGDAEISDAELDSANDYAGSSLTIVRSGGANGDDDFGFDTGAGTFTVSGGDLLAGGNAFASFTESGGTLTVDFNSSQTAATPSLADDVLQGITYANPANPVVVEYAVTATFNDGDAGGALQVSESRPVVIDPDLEPIDNSTTLDFTALEPELAHNDPVDARIIQELLFYGFSFEDATENNLVTSSDLQVANATSDANTTLNRMESDSTFRLDSIDIENFSTNPQDVTIHGYLNGSLQSSETFSFAGEEGPSTFDVDGLNAAFQSVDELRFTTSVSNSVAVDNIVVDSGNQSPTIDLNTAAGGNGSAVTFSESTDQGIAATDGVTVTGPVDVADADGTVDSVTVTLDNNQGDPGEQLYLDGSDLVGAVGGAGSGNSLTLSRNGAPESALEDTLANVRYQNNSDTPDLTTRTATVEVADNGGATASATSTITIEAGNDTPTITGPFGTLEPTEDVAFDLSGANEIQIADVDAGGATVEVSLSANNGTLTLGSTSGISFASGSNGNGAFTVAGTVADLNNALATLDYQGVSDYFGADTVSATVNDRGNTGTDPGATGDASSEQATTTISLDVQPVPDAPTISAIADQTMDEEATQTIAFTVNDAETAAGNLNVSHSVGDPTLIASISLGGSGANRTLGITTADEADGSTSVAVTVDDGSQTTNESFQLTVNAVDETPTFSATGPFSVSEADGNGTAVGDVDATDGDGGAADANVTYAIVGGNSGNAFAVNGGTGAITVNDASEIDFDTTSIFSLDLDADDGTNAPTATVAINVSNAAPSVPVDIDGASGGSVSEDAANGTAVGVTADSADPGGGNVSYALNDDAGGRFQINAGTGVVTVADAALIDFEAATSHSITIQASDDDGADSGAASFTIDVSDVDSPPSFTASGPFSVGEAPSNGTAVGDVDAEDGDGGSADAGITYAITGGNSAGAFAIDNIGMIEVADGSQIDFEESTSFALTIEADDGGNTASATVTVNVTDQPPAQPVDTDGAADAVAEDSANGDPVGVDVTSSDPAGGDITYTLTDNAGGRFAIDGNGLVTVADASLIDFEDATSHTLTIEASDADGTASATLSVTIAVTDVLESPTVTAPPGLTIDAAGLFTEIDLERDGTATAEDDEDGNLTPTPEDVTTPTWLRPGTHAITWSATDSDDQTGSDIQIVEVRPRVGIGPDRTVQEGTTIEIPIELNGDPIDGTTPSIDFDVVGGTADPADYAGLGAPGTVTIIAGKRGTIGFDVLDDGSGEAPETLVVELTGTAGDTVLAERTQVTITIVEDNTPPLVSLEAQQGANDPAVVVDGTVTDTVTITADTVDATAAAGMTFDWNDAETGLVDLGSDGDPATFQFDPSTAAPGVYDIEVTATDDDPSPLSGTASLQLRVIDPFPPLTGDDTDNDGLPDNDAAEGHPDRDGDALPDYRDPYADRSTVHAALADQSGYRLETEPGLSLSIGRVAFGIDKNGAQVSAADIANVLGLTDSRPNAGGYFDFRVDGLPTPGASVSVVVPQRTAIPAEPVYRKIDASGQWTDFVENGENSVSSALGARGYCPPPDDPTYSGGLTPGHWCVRLTIADGGPNDADGATDARVVDPGGVAEAIVPPTITNPPATSVQEDSTYEYLPQVDDADPGDTATFSVSGLPAWATFDTGTGALTGTPGNADVGVYGNIEITATDSYGATDSTGTFSIEVVNVNDAPTIGGTPAGQVAEDSAYSFTPVADDIDSGDSLVFSVINRPSWATFDPVDGTLSGTPGDGDVGTHPGIEIIVEDVAGASATLGPFAIEVTNVNDAPTLSAIGDQVTQEDQPSGEIGLSIDDVDDPIAALSLSLASDNPSLIASHQFTGSGGQRGLVLVPAPDAAGTANVTVSVSDGELDTAESFAFEVTPVNDPPRIVSVPNDVVIQGNGQTVPVSVEIDDLETSLGNLTVTATSSNQDVLPDGGIIVSGSGGERVIELSPSPSRSGTAVVTITVDDGTATSSASFGITVRPVAVPGLSWQGLLILAVLMSIFGAAFIRR